MSDSVWYYARGEQEKGPITTVQIKALSAAGKLQKDDFVWKEGMDPQAGMLRLVVGLGMMPRGEVGLIFLGLGSQAGILTPALEAAILLMVIGTTFLAPILLRVVIPPEPAG